MEQFPHLNFVQKITGKPRFFGGGSANDRTKDNKLNRDKHGGKLFQKTSKIRQGWVEAVSKREEQNLAPLGEDTVPIFLQINPDLIDADFDLLGVGIEIISEEKDGFIIGASLDNLQSLDEKINGFIAQKYGTAGIADLWEIIEGNREEWKPQHVLSNELFEKWDTIDDAMTYQIEVSIAFDRPIGKEPNPNKKGGARRLEKYRNLQIERDERLREREEHFDGFVSNYGEIKSSLVYLEDSFGCLVEISGKGLKDLVFNYPFVFEVTEAEELGNIGGTGELNGDVNLKLKLLTKDHLR